ncbi:hypothetical protein [Geodermatophilus sp. SYSU D00815]
MTTTEPTDHPLIHFVSAMSVPTSLSTLGVGRVFRYGDELTVTPEVREANRDRNGVCWLDWLDTSADAYTRNGQEVCRRGPWPEGQLRMEPGSPAWEDARRRAIAEALAVVDPEERREARRRVDVEFGPSGSTSRTLQEIKHRDGEARQ